MPDELDPKEARQGRRGPRVLVVLIVGLILAVIIWAIVDIVVMTGPSDEGPVENPGAHPPAGTQLNTQPPPAPREPTPQ